MSQGARLPGSGPKGAQPGGRVPPPRTQRGRFWDVFEGALREWCEARWAQGGDPAAYARRVRENWEHRGLGAVHGRGKLAWEKAVWGKVAEAFSVENTYLGLRLALDEEGF